LSVHIEGDHPVDVPFLFEGSKKRAPGAVFASAFVHGLAFLFILVGIHRAAIVAETEAKVRTQIPAGIVFIAQPGPGGGGGGGGSQSKERPKLIDVSKLKFDVPKPVAMEMPKDIAPPPPAVPQLTLAAKDLGDQTQVVGTFDGVPNGIGGGSGSGGGGGTGTGGGIGPGRGNGIGDGWGGGIGGGAYQPGNGVSTPRPIREVKPLYTADAMRAKIQGTAIVECVVMPDGTVGPARIVKSLDPNFGLDQEAVKAARQWRFIPGTLKGQPVPVSVLIELLFTLR
jgi:TonB family protein